MAANVQEQPPAAEATGTAPASFLDWLVGNQSLTPVLAERVARVQADTCDRLSAILLKLGLLSEPALAEGLARYGGLQRFVPGTLPVQAIAFALTALPPVLSAQRSSY